MVIYIIIISIQHKEFIYGLYQDLVNMFITHDLSVVKHISDEIMVMYLGKCVERASSDEIFKNPLHPYTKALLAAIPIPSVESCHVVRELLQGEVTSPVHLHRLLKFLPV